jgi:hypothetical protein
MIIGEDDRLSLEALVLAAIKIQPAPAPMIQPARIPAPDR